MSLIDFPDPRSHAYAKWVSDGEYYYHADGIVYLGGELSVENLRRAYGSGIFPWYTSGLPLPWHCPDPRAIFDFADLRVPRSLARLQKNCPFDFSIDRDFDGVIRACSAAKRPDQPGTWITSEFIEVFTEFHRLGEAHSVEAWDSKGDLVGGLYGVDAGGVFCGESMFYREPNASKLSLLFLIDHLQSRGSTWLDSQVITPHMKALGAVEIGRNSFLDKLAATQDLGLTLF